ncbi:hypothetical protein [Nonomuraea turcica]|uniref:hypothetical protein n=1 Tax=Nonomuraea sp. G32 TaxID=3067274 RepID=UPI00273C2926|nr:hypothetical protein [Nonomuraea sp. G32]MDP4510113.1 hypothetical protein [Nonomuraea sp. G32]
MRYQQARQAQVRLAGLLVLPAAPTRTGPMVHSPGVRICVRMLLGVPDTAAGNVPRALALAGVDRAELMARVQETLAHERW